MKVRPILFSAPMVRAILAGTKTQTRRLVAPSPGLQRTWLTPELIGTVPHGEMIKGGWQMHHPRAGQVMPGPVGPITIEHNSPLGWVRCPYGEPGDRLWVRERWQIYGWDDGELIVRYADGALQQCDLEESSRSDDWERYALQSEDDCKKSGLVCGDHGYHWDDPAQTPTRWRPSIHMPRWASRITLEITDVRVERLQDISEADAKAEGVLPFGDAYSCFSPEQPITCGDGRPSFAAGSRPYAASYAVLWDEINGDRSPWVSNPWVWAVSFKRALS